MNKKCQKVFYKLTACVHFRTEKKEGIVFIILDMNPNLWIHDCED